MANRALVTGVDGFTGLHVVGELISRGYEVVGLTRTGNAEHAWRACDLGDREKVLRHVAEIRPSVVVHLAGVSSVVHGDAAEIYSTNIVATRNLLEGLAQHADSVDLVLLPSSAHVYGPSTGGVLTERSPLAPHNDYAVSKVAMEYMAALWASRLPLLITRPFNYTGVGQSTSFLVPKIVDHFRRRASAITLGNLDVSRDFSDVRDLAHCYGRLVDARRAGLTLNVCSDRTYSLREIIGLCELLTGHHLEVKSDPALMRAGEVKSLRGSNAALRETIGEVDFRPLRETLSWMLEHG